MEEDPSGAAHLVKPVHIVGQQVDYLACGGLPHGRATQTKYLVRERYRELDCQVPGFGVSQGSVEDLREGFFLSNSHFFCVQLRCNNVCCPVDENFVFLIIGSSILSPLG